MFRIFCLKDLNFLWLSLLKISWKLKYLQKLLFTKLQRNGMKSANAKHWDMNSSILNWRCLKIIQFIFYRIQTDRNKLENTKTLTWSQISWGLTNGGLGSSTHPSCTASGLTSSSCTEKRPNLLSTVCYNKYNIRFQQQYKQPKAK